MENALDAKHPKVVLRHAKTLSIGSILTQNGGIRAEWMAGINKRARDTSKLRLWVDHADSTSRTNAMPTLHRQ